MIILHGEDAIEKLPLDGNGSDIVKGALVTPGVTAGQDLSTYIVSGAAGDDVIGILLSIHDFSVVGDSTPEDGLAYVRGEIAYVNPNTILAAEYANTASDDIDVASYNNSTGVVTITSLENNIDGSWLFVRAGSGIGQLGYLKASASGNATFKSVLTTDLSSSSKVLKILRNGHRPLFLNTDRDKLSSQAAAGTFKARIIKSQFRATSSEGWEDLDPTKHHDLQLDSQQAGFRSLIVLENGFFAPND